MRWKPEMNATRVLPSEPTNPFFPAAKKNFAGQNGNTSPNRRNCINLSRMTYLISCENYPVTGQFVGFLKKRKCRFPMDTHYATALTYFAKSICWTLTLMLKAIFMKACFGVSAHRRRPDNF